MPPKYQPQGVATAPEKSPRFLANSAKYKWGWFPFFIGHVHLVKMHCAGRDPSDWPGSSLNTLFQTQAQLLCLFWQAARSRRIPQTTTDQQGLSLGKLQSYLLRFPRANTTPLFSLWLLLSDLVPRHTHERLTAAFRLAARA